MAGQDDLNSEQSESQSSSKSKQNGEQSKSDSSKKQQGDQQSDMPGDTPAEGDSDAGGEGEDSTVEAKRFDGDPWFAKLPPSLRKAIQARARRNAPKGYEERLRRYFQSID